MAITVRLTNKSQVTKKQDTLVAEDLLLSRAVYQTLGSLIGNREMATLELDGSYTIYYDKLTEEYTTLMEDMNNLWLHTYYSDLAVANNVPQPSPSIVTTNEYLGDLGETVTYSYSKDFVNIPAWTKANPQTEYRILVDATDNTYLVDPADGTVLVTYT